MRFRSLLTVSVAALLMTTLLEMGTMPARAADTSTTARAMAGGSSGQDASRPAKPTPTTHGGRRSSTVSGHPPKAAPRAAQNQAAAAAKPPPGTAPANPTANIPAAPAFPDDCYFAPNSLTCANPELAALNHARQVLGQPKYQLPGNFSELTPAAKLLLLSNSDRALYGLEPVLSYNPTLNAVAQQGAVEDVDPSPPEKVGSQVAAGWSANWAGGIPTVVQAYYEWMYDDGVGSNNIDCTAQDRSGCWGHRMDTLYNFGSAKLHMGFGSVTNDPYFAWSFSTVYWANASSGSVAYLPVVTGSGGKSANSAGGTKITLAGAGFTGATGVHLGARTAAPTVLDNNHLTFTAPAGTGVPQITVTGTGGTSGGSSAATVAYLAARSAGSYLALTPARLLDTRIGVGARKAKVAPKGTVSLLVSGRGGVPAAGVSSVILNVTAVKPSGVGFLTVYPWGRPQPIASNLNFQTGQTTANSVLVPIGPNGKVLLTNTSRISVDLLTDVMGYIVSGTATKAGAVAPLSPARILDTRVGLGAAKGKLGASAGMSLPVLGRAGVPSSGVSAVVVNLTAVTPKSAGFIVAWANGGARPTASNVNLRTGQSTPNLAVVPVGANGRISLFNGSGKPVDLVVDVAGYLRSGTANVVGGAVAVTPARLMDTRTGLGIGPYPPYLTPPDPGSTWVVGQNLPVPLKVTGRAGVPESGVSAVILNVTVVNPNRVGSLTVYATGYGLPKSSNLNYIVGQTVSNLVVAPVGRGGYASFFPQSSGASGLVVDVTGYVLTPQS